MTFHLYVQGKETTYEDADEAMGEFTAALLRGQKPRLVDDTTNEERVSMQEAPDHTQN